MKALTFPGGIHPEYFKDISIREPLRELPMPDRVIIPLSQHIGAPNKALVAKGDYVEEAQIIAENSSYVSSPVHSSVSGTVIALEKAFHPTLGPTLSIIIERDKEKPQKKYTENDVDKFNEAEIIQRIKKAGIVGMGGAAFPTHVKLNVPEGKEIDTLIINGAECEPFLTCDHVLMTKRTHDILRGIEILIKVVKPKQTYIAIEENKMAAYFAFKRMIKDSPRGKISTIKLALLETKYPQGGEKQLIKAISGREVPPGKLPIDIGFLVQNVGTAYAICQAIYFDKPLIERIVTISGDCLDRPGNYIIKVGTTIREIVDKYGIGMYKEPKKIIVGGPMMGFAQPDLDAPVLKSTSGILFLTGEYVKDFEEENCVKCAKCVDVCPVSVSPTQIMKNVKAQKWDEMEKLVVGDCMECGACAYECPARIPLVQYIKQGKIELRKISQ